MGFIDELKSIAQAVADTGNHELYGKLQELSKAAYELQIEILELREENRKLNGLILESGKCTVINQCYYFDDKGPYCTRCYDVDGKKVRMTLIETLYKPKNICPHCNHGVYDLPY